MLHNFGGNIEMYGILDSIASGPIDARTSYNSTMVCTLFSLMELIYKFLQFHVWVKNIYCLLDQFSKESMLFCHICSLFWLISHSSFMMMQVFETNAFSMMLLMNTYGVSLALAIFLDWCWHVHGGNRAESSCLWTYVRNGISW